MCHEARFLNSLPTIQRCCCGKAIPLRNAFEIFSKLGLIFFTPILLFVLIRPELMGFKEDAFFKYWFVFLQLLWITSCILLFLEWLTCCQSKTIQDRILRIHFWLVVSTTVFHCIFCLAFTIFCEDINRTAAYFHLFAWMALLIVLPYPLLIINSYRKTLGLPAMT